MLSAIPSAMLDVIQRPTLSRITRDEAPFLNALTKLSRAPLDLVFQPSGCVFNPVLEFFHSLSTDVHQFSGEFLNTSNDIGH